MNQKSLIRQNIDFKKIAQEHGVTRGEIFYSPTWKSWVLSGHPTIDLIAIEAPHKRGDIIDGKMVESVSIDNNQWVFECA